MKKNLLLAFLAYPTFFYSQQTNLIQNGGFEEYFAPNFNNWTEEGDVSIFRLEPTNGYKGISLETGTTTPKIIATNYTVQAGVTYTLRFDYKVRTGSATFGQQVIGYKYGGADFTPNTSSSAIPQNFEWTTVTKEFTPDTTEEWYFELSLNSFIADPFEVLIDNVQIFNSIETNPDKAALTAFYNATGGDGWENKWNLDAKLDNRWAGVTVDGNNRVTEISLIRDQLTGTLPSEIGNLEFLQTLVLQENSLSGAIPSELANLSVLRALNIADNNFDGAIPASIGNITSLQHLNLFRNQFSGEIPAAIGNLSNLVTLNLSFNSLTGNIPVELFNLANLENLIITDNLFSGNIPSQIGNLSSLKILRIGGENITGSLPAEIGNITTLETLWAYRTKLSGKIPTVISILPNLDDFLISENNFVFDDFEDDFTTYNGYSRFIYSPQATVDNAETIEIVSGQNIILSVDATQSINNIYQWRKDGVDLVGENARTFTISNPTPSDIGEYDCIITNSAIADLTLQRNIINVTSGIVVSQIEKDALIALYNATDGPNWTNTWDLNADVSTWHGVTLNSTGNVIDLNLFDNNLKGTIPSQIGDFSKLESLNFDNNTLTGQVPIEIEKLASSLKRLSLSLNELEGEFPIQITKLVTLEKLDISRNSLTGELPVEIGNLIELRTLLLGDNSLTGEIPNQIGNLVNLVTLNLRLNNLTGAIPNEIGNLTNLLIVNLGLNNLSGAIPSQIGNLTRLRELLLAENGLTGSIPVEIENLTQLQKLSLTRNQLTGDIPAGIVNLTGLRELSLLSNKLTGSIPTGMGNLTNLKSLNLSNNELIGTISDEIGNLINLEKLSLSDNAFTGQIPIALGNLINLTTLSLTGNQLTGTIPAEIGNLTKLNFLGAGVNKLTGEIPAEIGNLTELENLNLTVNELSGSIPTQIGNLTKVYALDLSSNKLTGEIPIEIGNVRELRFLNLSFNELSGPIPSEIAIPTKLEAISLNFNKLTGRIPSEIGNLTELNTIIINDNNLSGAIPSSITTLANLSTFYIIDNNFVFEDFEDNFNELLDKGMTYSTQANVDNEESITISNKASVSLSINATSSPNNTYQWQKDGKDIPGATRRSYVITNASASDSGVYDCFIRNTLVTGLTLRREKVTISIDTITTDSDGDGISDEKDQCPNTAAGEVVNINGCSQSQLDDDNDGVTNDKDQCPDTTAGEVVDINGCSQTQTLEDQDNDGVANHIDLCPNTPSGDIVDTFGCSVSQLVDINPSDISIMATSTSCANTANGEITFNFNKDYRYTIDLSSTTFTRRYQDIRFDTAFVIDNLEANTYEIIVSTPDLRGFSQSYILEIQTPADLKVAKTQIDKKTATYTVSGSKYYNVTVNAKSYEFNFEDTSARQISFDIQDGSNSIEIKTDKVCQGKFNKIITNGTLSFYPIPTNNELNILGLGGIKTVISVTNLTGAVVFSKTVDNKDLYTIPMQNMASGMYLVTVTTTTQTINTKIFKK